MTVIKKKPAPGEIKFPSIPTLFIEGGKDSLDTKKGHNKVDSFRENEYSINGSSAA